MGYRLLSAQEAAGLPRRHGSLGMDIERARDITDAGMTFELIRVKQVGAGLAAERAGLQAGDQIIAVDGRIFPTLASFAAYAGSLAPGSQALIDYIPAGGGPGQAQRVTLTVGSPSGTPRNGPQAGSGQGMSTGEKVAIGVGAAALLGCYEMGCFSHRNSTSGQAPAAGVSR